MKILEPLVRRPNNLVTPASFGFNGSRYPIYGWQGSRPDWPDRDFLGYISGVHERNGVVAAAVETRALLMSQLHFGWDVDGELVQNRSSRSLNNPSATVTRPSFLKSLEYDTSYHGSAYITYRDGTYRRCRPDHCTVVLESVSDPEWGGADAQVELPHDAEVTGLIYHPRSMTGGPIDFDGAEMFSRSEFAIWSPEPDPLAIWRGTSWVTSVMKEIVGDNQATDHTADFLSNAATPNLVFMMDPSKEAQEIQEFADALNAKHTGSGKAFRNMFLGGGTDVKSVGSSLDSLNLKDLTGGYETRIALRSRIPAVILGVREGLSGSSLNSGNYNSARRMLADGWFSPTAESLCASLERLAAKPNPNAELCYDRDRVLFLQEDQKDAADIAQTDAATMRQLIDGGYNPTSVTEAVMTRDWSKLKHTGKTSVQLQEPGADAPQEATDDEDA